MSSNHNDYYLVQDIEIPYYGVIKHCLTTSNEWAIAAHLTKLRLFTKTEARKIQKNNPRVAIIKVKS